LKPHVAVVILGFFLVPAAAAISLVWPSLGIIVAGSLATALSATAAYLSSEGQ
jgi:hypothetical protein